MQMLNNIPAEKDLAFSPDLKFVKELVYDKCGFDFTNLNINLESVEYGACSFLLNEKLILHRASKTTPTKTGQFVTIWKRNQSGITVPYDFDDNFEFLIITVRKDDNLGQFIFPKNILAEKGIISQNNKGGKRGIRVYAPWDIVTSKQAEKTQNWQSNYFLTIKSHDSTELNVESVYFYFN